MKKLVLKTAVFTFIGIVALIGVIYGALGIFAPSVLGDFYKTAGNHGLAISYYSRACDKSGNINDLVKLCDTINEETDGIVGVKYFDLLVNHKDFEKYCKTYDEKYDKVIIPIKELYCGKYFTCSYNAFGLSEAGKIATKVLNLTGYSEYNCWYLFITESTKQFRNEELTDIEQLVSASKVTTLKEVEYRNRDISIIRGKRLK